MAEIKGPSCQLTNFVLGCFDAMGVARPHKRPRDDLVASRFVSKHRKLLRGLVSRISQQIEKEDEDVLEKAKLHFPEATWLNDCSLVYDFSQLPLEEGLHTFGPDDKLPAPKWDIYVSLYLPNVANSKDEPPKRIYRLLLECCQPYILVEMSPECQQISVGRFSAGATVNYLKDLTSHDIEFSQVDSIGVFIYDELLKGIVSEYYRGYLSRTVQ